MEHYAGRSIDVKVLPYIEDHEELIEQIKNSNLGLYLSWHEGFGLAAWEAIGLGIPVILNKHMGVYKLLDEKVGGRALGTIGGVVDITDSQERDANQLSKRDIREVTTAICNFIARSERKISEARDLRDILEERFTWEKAVTQFLVDLDVLRPEVSHRDERFIVEAIAKQERDAVRMLVTTGDYEAAIQLITKRKEEGEVSPELLVQEADAMLRLSQYANAKETAERVAADAERCGAWRLWIDAQGIINTIERDLSQYEEAIARAREMVEIASTREPTKVPSCRRKLARSLALAQRSEALEEALAALRALKDSQDEDGVAKALLAVGEALRHGGSIGASIEYYENARGQAQRVKNWDCFLWAVLCLADALLLDGQENEARLCLEELDGIFQLPTKRFPVEELHFRFSIAILEYDPLDPRIDDLVADYKKIGIMWPSAYVNSWRQGDRQPKRF